MGLTVVDSGVIIGFLDADDVHHESALSAFAEAVDRGDKLVLPASAYAECLVGPSRRGYSAVAVVDDFLAGVPVAVAALDQPVARQAARLRARHGTRLRLPDALVVASAIVFDADVLVTTDRGWPTRRALGLTCRLVRL